MLEKYKIATCKQGQYHKETCQNSDLRKQVILLFNFSFVEGCLKRKTLVFSR